MSDRRNPGEEPPARAGERLRLRVTVRGRVQGVFFRGSTQQQATREGVDGWVRNLPDGAVEAVFEGQPEAVAALVAFARQGPLYAQVRGVEVRSEPPQGERGFRVLSGSPRESPRGE